MNFKHIVCKECVRKGTIECPIAYVECGEVLGNYFDVNPNTFYCVEAKNEYGAKYTIHDDKKYYKERLQNA